ncbi:hypothetical protein IN07_19320 [Modestobacter caceresii]|jgi:AmiR/NasT family two-component response regulator|uniref:ANTAR domain-containing protein n=1 Tax=Modestobacter caceresii TaxID=1522368 RepID=A0A098Y3P2_9ACTN|nr:hypothetical protein IN07_19320 [Modestobacter caceresii]
MSVWDGAVAVPVTVVSRSKGEETGVTERVETSIEARLARSLEELASSREETAVSRAETATSREETAAARVRVADLEAALRSARTIGMAMGILMSSRRIPEQAAFDALVNASQHQNRKLREVAEDVVLAGRL